MVVMSASTNKPIRSVCQACLRFYCVGYHQSVRHQCFCPGSSSHQTRQLHSRRSAVSTFVSTGSRIDSPAEVLQRVYHSKYYSVCIIQRTTACVSFKVLQRVYHSKYYSVCIIQSTTACVSFKAPCDVSCGTLHP